MRSQMYIVAFLAIAGGTVAGPDSAADPPGVACQRTTFKTALVSQACANGGQPAARAAMKAFMVGAHLRSCKSCHVALAPTFELRPDALTRFLEAGGTLLGTPSSGNDSGQAGSATSGNDRAPPSPPTHAADPHKMLIGRWRSDRGNIIIEFDKGGSMRLLAGMTVVPGQYEWVDAEAIAVDTNVNGKAVHDKLKLTISRDGNTIQTIDGGGNVDQMQRLELAHVSVDGAVIGLAKTDGRSWDGGEFPSGALQQFQSAAMKFGSQATDPRVAMGAVVAAIGAASIDYSAQPDPVGWAELWVDGHQIGSRLPIKKQQNTYRPSWDMLTWQHVPLNESVEIKIHLEDADFFKHADNIADVIINEKDLARAERDGHEFPIYVGGQCQNQLVSLNVSVIQEGM